MELSEAKIYVASLSDYNEGKGIGKWMDLEDYSSGSEVADAIAEYLEELNEKDAGHREEYAIHDFENFPKRFYSESMGEKDFDEIYEFFEVVESSDIPADVLDEYVTNGNDLDSASDNFHGKYDDRKDFAYQTVEELGIGSFNNPESYITMSDTDKRITAGEEADSIVDGMSDDELIEEAGMDGDKSELEEKVSELETEIEDLESEKSELEDNLTDLEAEIRDLQEEDEPDEDEITKKEDEVLEKKDEISEKEKEISEKESEKEKKESELEGIVENAKEKVQSDKADEIEEKLDDPYNYFVNEQGMYSPEDFYKASFIMIDYEQVADDLEQDYEIIDGEDGNIYVFRNYAKGGKVAKGSRNGKSDLLRLEITTDTMFQPTGSFPMAVFITPAERERLTNYFKGGTWYFVDATRVKGFNGKEWGYTSGHPSKVETLDEYYQKTYGKKYHAKGGMAGSDFSDYYAQHGALITGGSYFGSGSTMEKGGGVEKGKYKLDDIVETKKGDIFKISSRGVTGSGIVYGGSLYKKTKGKAIISGQIKGIRERDITGLYEGETKSGGVKEITPAMKKEIISYLEKNPPEMYWDRNSDLSNEQVEKIISSEDGIHEVSNELYDMNIDYIFDQEEEAIKELIGRFKLADTDDENYDEDELVKELKDEFQEYIHVDMNIEQLIRNTHRPKITLNTDYSLDENEFNRIEYSNVEMILDLFNINPKTFGELLRSGHGFTESGKAGYANKDISSFPDMPERNGKEKVKPADLVEDIANTNYSGGQLVFLMHLDLNGFIKNRKEIMENGFILKSGTSGHFHNYANGSGGVGFDTISDIIFKKSEIHYKFQEDESISYGVQNTYGLVGDAWNGTIELLDGKKMEKGGKVKSVVKKISRKGRTAFVAKKSKPQPKKKPVVDKSNMEWNEIALIELRELDKDDTLVEQRWLAGFNGFEAEGEHTSNRSYLVFQNEEEADKYAIDRVKTDLEEQPELFSQDWLIDQLDSEKTEEFFRTVNDEHSESYARDILRESYEGDYANRLAEEMYDRGIIGEDEAKDKDFDFESKIDEFVKNYTQEALDEGNNGYDHAKFNFGLEYAMKLVMDNNLIDVDTASENAVSEDGAGHFLSGYDGRTINLPSGAVAYKN